MTWGGPSLPSGLDQFTAKQQPNPTPVDGLSLFVMQRIREAETEPVVDQVPKHYHEIHGAAAHRYAAKVREDMVAFRRIVKLYVEAVAAVEAAEDGYVNDAEEDRAFGLRQAVAILAMRWEQHPEFRDDWRL